MRTVRFGLGLLLAASMLSGCNSGGLAAYKKYHLGPAEQPVAVAIESSGGLAGWRRVGLIRADALMTIYADDGQPYVNRQKHEIDINGRRLTIKASAAKSWRASYSSRWGESFSLSGAAAPGRFSSADLRETMAVLLHRLVGPLNLLGGKEAPGAVAEVSVDGQHLIRVAATGDKAMATAYYFAPAGGGLRMVTSGSERPGRQGTVTLYEYQILSNGLVFPKKIKLVRTGSHVLVGPETIMEVEYSDVTVR